MGITLAPFRVDLPSGLLFRGEQAIALRPKTWAVLLYLAERPGLLVSRDQLLDAVWPEVVVTPETLNKSIAELRAVLGDDRKAPRFIETVHRRGFRFIAPVSDVPGHESLPVKTLTPATRHLAPDIVSDVPKPESSRRPFVGRQEELRLLATRLAKARAGQRQIVFVTGEAGVGKTALVDAFLDSRVVCESAEPLSIGRAGCFEHHGPQEPYLPVFEALERLARPPRVGRLVRLMRRAAPMWLTQMPWLVGEADADALRRSLQGARPERMPRELAALIGALTTDLTVVLVLEDLHWSDPSTIDVLTLLAQRREPQRLLVIGTYRPAEAAVRAHALAGAVRTLHEHQQCERLPLHDLTEESVRTYLTVRFPGNDFPQRSRIGSTRTPVGNRCSSSPSRADAVRGPDEWRAYLARLYQPRVARASAAGGIPARR